MITSSSLSSCSIFSSYSIMLFVSSRSDSTLLSNDILLLWSRKRFSSSLWRSSAMILACGLLATRTLSIPATTSFSSAIFAASARWLFRWTSALDARSLLCDVSLSSFPSIWCSFAADILVDGFAATSLVICVLRTARPLLSCLIRSSSFLLLLSLAELPPLSSSTLFSRSSSLSMLCSIVQMFSATIIPVGLACTSFDVI